MWAFQATFSFQHVMTEVTFLKVRHDTPRHRPHYISSTRTHNILRRVTSRCPVPEWHHLWFGCLTRGARRPAPHLHFRLTLAVLGSVPCGADPPGFRSRLLSAALVRWGFSGDTADCVFMPQKPCKLPWMKMSGPEERKRHEGGGDNVGVHKGRGGEDTVRLRHRRPSLSHYTQCSLISNQRKMGLSSQMLLD